MYTAPCATRVSPVFTLSDNIPVQGVVTKLSGLTQRERKGKKLVWTDGLLVKRTYCSLKKNLIFTYVSVLSTCIYVHHHQVTKSVL